MKSLRRVLVVHPFGIGDFLFMTPVLRALRLVPTVESVDLLLGSRTREVAEANPHVDVVWVLDKERMHEQDFLTRIREWIVLGRQLKKRRYDLLLDYSLSREYGFWAAAYLGIAKRAGFDYKSRGFFHTHRLSLPDGFCQRHVVDYYAELAELAGIPVDVRHMEFYLPPGARERAQQILRRQGILPHEKIITIAPGGGESWGRDARLKRWPAPVMAEFVKRLAQTSMPDKMIVAGSSKESDLADELTRQLGPAAVNLAGKLTLPETAAVIRDSRFFVGNDGGLVHVAHALRTPLIAVYGPANPVVYGPYPSSSSALAIYNPNASCRPCYTRFRYHAHCRSLEETSAAFAWDLTEKSGILNIGKCAVS